MITPANKIIIKKIGLLVIFFSCIFSFPACAGSDDSAKSSLVNSDEGKTAFSFTTDENGFPVNWKVYFDDGEISALYRNRIRIPKDQISKYKEMVYEEMDACYNNKFNREADNDFDIHINLNSLNKSLERLSRELSDKKIHIEFDEKQFEKNMKKLEKELEKLKDMDIEINIDPETFKENMRELEENLKHLKINENDFPFGKNKLDKCIKELTEKMSNEQFTMNNDLRINMDHLYKNMANLKFNMNNLNINMDHVKSRLRCMNSFIKEMKSELVKDGIIKNENEDIEINFSSDGLEINDERVPDHLFEKYKSLYKKHFGTELDEDCDIRVR